MNIKVDEKKFKEVVKKNGTSYAELAKQLGYNQNYFYSLFKQSSSFAPVMVAALESFGIFSKDYEKVEEVKTDDKEINSNTYWIATNENIKKAIDLLEENNILLKDFIQSMYKMYGNYGR